MKLHFTKEWLRRGIETDPDTSVEAGNLEGQSMKDHDKKPGWQFFKIWGGDNRQYRLLQTVVFWVGVAVVAWIIFRG